MPNTIIEWDDQVAVTTKESDEPLQVTVHCIDAILDFNALPVWEFQSGDRKRRALFPDVRDPDAPLTVPDYQLMFDRTRKDGFDIFSGEECMHGLHIQITMPDYHHPEKTVTTQHMTFLPRRVTWKDLKLFGVPAVYVAEALHS